MVEVGSAPHPPPRWSPNGGRGGDTPSTAVGSLTALACTGDGVVAVVVVGCCGVLAQVEQEAGEGLARLGGEQHALSRPTVRGPIRAAGWGPW
mmetsp:Transcript_122721/g.281372  ORF Transcript_122721/g.281372 Transcript_122721/m.281372 type:complete len:93 (+) Transcript_122721:3608-3886(+)